MVLDAQTPSQTIRHEKLHDIRHQECPDWTILKDFMPSEQKTSFPEIKQNHELILKYLATFIFYLITITNLSVFNLAQGNILTQKF